MGKVHAEGIRRLCRTSTSSPWRVSTTKRPRASAKRSASSAPPATTAPCWPIRKSRPSTSARRTPCTSRSPRTPSWPASTCSARSRWPCPPPRPRELVDARASRQNVANCINHNLRYYPVVQQMRRMIAKPASWARSWSCRAPTRRTGCSTTPTGTGASRRRPTAPLRAMGDIGSHWMDMIQHVTGLRITSLCADLQTFHKTRKKPKGAVETFAGKKLQPGRLRRGRRSTPRTSAPCCCAWATARAARSPSARCRPAARTASRSRSSAPSAASSGTRSGRTSCGSATATRPISSSSRTRRC